jgi:small subunit ribosomal protein S17
MTEQQERNRRKIRQGIVVSDGRDKTITVEISDSVLHPKYAKTVGRRTRLHVHDESNDARRGDTVRVTETRPLSKTKRWRLETIVERAR